MSAKELLICIVNDTLLLDDILEGFLENGVSGATVVDSRGMGQILTTDIPIFTGLKTLFPGGGAGGHMILSVMDHEKAQEIIPVIEEICSHFDQPGVGFLFTVPVLRIQGFKPAKDHDK